MQEARILLGSWLLGYNIEDMNQFTEDEFGEYGQIFRLLKAGKTGLSISKELHISIAELATMQGEYSFTFYTQIVEEWMRRKILHQLAELSLNNDDVETIKEKIDWILSNRTTIKPAERMAEEFGMVLVSREKSKPLHYGIPTLDRLTGGLKPKELTVIAARPSTGKSALALQIADVIQNKGHKVLYFPLEMSTMQTLERLCIREKLASPKELMTGKLTKESYGRSLDYIDAIEKRGCLKIYEGQGNIDIIHTAIKNEKPEVIVLDQLTQLKANRNFTSIRERFTYMTSTLKSIAMQEHVSIILLCQINRDAQNNVPTMANLKESGSIEEDADNVILLYKVDKDDLRHPEEWHAYEVPIHVNLAKHRAGQTGEFMMAFMPEQMRFYEHAKKGGNL